MPPRKRTSSVLNGDAHDGPKASDADAALSLADQAEAAEAEAAEAEALAAAARARTRALRLRKQAEAAAARTASAAATARADEVRGDLLKQAAAVEDEDEDADETSDVDLEDAEPVRRRRLRLPHVSLRIAAAALVVVASVGLLAASGFMIWHHREVAAEQQRSAEFAAAARQGVVTLMSLDFNRADEDVKRILDNTTGDFKKDFETQAPEFTQVAKESKVVTEATVNATAVEKMTKDTATVLVAVTTNVSNTASKEQQPRSWRLSVDVARDGGQIKLAKVEFVP